MLLRIGVVPGQLPRVRADLVAEMLREAHPALDVQLVDVPGSPGLEASRTAAACSTNALQQALRDATIDAAVHAYDALPARRVDGLVLAAIPLRDDPRDVLVSPAPRRTLRKLPSGTVVASSTPGRAVQLRAIRPDLEVRLVAGATEALLAELDAGVHDAVVVALADLRCLGLEARAGEVLGLYDVIPAAAQGALALQCRADDSATRSLLAAIDEPALRPAVTAERSFLAEVEATGAVAAAAYAEHFGSTIKIHAMLAPQGEIVRGKITGAVEDAVGLGRELARELMGRSNVSKNAP